MKLNPSMLCSFDYEVFGLVQGVHFRYYTCKFATKLNLVGWVENTNQSTVVGTIQGKVKDLASMVYFLNYIGSPHSKIDRCELKNCRLIDKLEYTDFRVKKSYSDVRQTEEVSQESKEIESELRELGKLNFESKKN